MKLLAVSSRGSKKDFVDIKQILKILGKVSLSELITQKFPQSDIEFVHILRSLSYYDVAEKEPDPKMLVEWDWGETKKYFDRLVKNINL